jgi:5'-deoxynucleotidase YfbR-like HD superfamily hydrolase
MSLVETFKKEIGELEGKKKSFEHQIIKMQTQYENAVKMLETEFGIPPENLDELIKQKAERMRTLEASIKDAIAKLQAYILKIGEVLNGRGS